MKNIKIQIPQIPVKLYDEQNQEIEFDLFKFTSNYHLYFELNFNGFGSTRALKLRKMKEGEVSIITPKSITEEQKHLIQFSNSKGKINFDKTSEPKFNLFVQKGKTILLNETFEIKIKQFSVSDIQTQNNGIHISNINQNELEDYATELKIQTFQGKYFQVVQVLGNCGALENCFELSLTFSNNFEYLQTYGFQLNAYISPIILPENTLAKDIVLQLVYDKFDSKSTKFFTQSNGMSTIQRINPTIFYPSLYSAFQINEETSELLSLTSDRLVSIQNYESGKFNILLHRKSMTSDDRSSSILNDIFPSFSQFQIHFMNNMTLQNYLTKYSTQYEQLLSQQFAFTAFSKSNVFQDTVANRKKFEFSNLIKMEKQLAYQVSIGNDVSSYSLSIYNTISIMNKNISLNFAYKEKNYSVALSKLCGGDCLINSKITQKSQEIQQNGFLEIEVMLNQPINYLFIYLLSFLFCYFNRELSEINETEINETETNETETNETETNETETNETETNETEKNETETNETETNETETNETKTNETETNETETNKTETNETETNETETNETETNETETNQTENNNTETNQTENNNTETNQTENNNTQTNQNYSNISYFDTIVANRECYSKMKLVELIQVLMSLMILLLM